MNDKINIRQALLNIDEYWSQQTLGEANGQLYKVAKGQGATHWHKHDDQDELFILYEGQLNIELRDKVVELLPDDLFIVPRGAEHRAIAPTDAKFLIVGLSITSTPEGGKPN